jgi:hypothetical protein
LIIADGEQWSTAGGATARYSSFAHGAPNGNDDASQNYRFFYDKTTSVPDQISLPKFMAYFVDGLADEHGRIHALAEVKARMHLSTD